MVISKAASTSRTSSGLSAELCFKTFTQRILTEMESVFTRDANTEPQARDTVHDYKVNMPCPSTPSNHAYGELIMGDKPIDEAIAELDTIFLTKPGRNSSWSRKASRRDPGHASNALEISKRLFFTGSCSWHWPVGPVENPINAG